jgi:uncharacterized protein
VTDKLKFYVYRLIDPRNGETFYVGKGKGNRVLAHIRDELQRLEVDEDATSLKLKRIRDIRNAHFEVAHVIHRHGMDGNNAFEVEAAIIDAFPGLSNEVGGAGSKDRGAMHVREIMQIYGAKIARFEHRALLICVNREATNRSIYEATRYCWKVNQSRATKAEVVLAVQMGLIVEAFVDCQWKEATAENFPQYEPCPGRWGFEGKVAPKAVRELYVGTRVPDEYRKKGAAYPIKYTWR